MRRSHTQLRHFEALEIRELLAADLFEMNDSRQAATDLGTRESESTVGELSLHTPTDEDWFRIELSENGTSQNFVQIFADTEPDPFDMELVIYNHLGEVIAERWRSHSCHHERGCPGGSHVTLKLDEVPQGAYWLKVSSPGNLAIDNYRINFNAPQATDPSQIAITELGAGGILDRTGIGPNWGNSIDAVGDVNGDGYDDFVLRSDNSLGRIVFGSADRSISHSRSISGLDRRGKIVGGLDVNGDGFHDVAMFSENGLANDNVKLYLGRSSTELFGLAPDFVWNGAKSVAMLPDMDGDGLADLAIGRQGEIEIIFGNKSGFEDASSYKIPSQDFRFGSNLSHAGDLNGDGLSDLVIAVGNDVALVYGQFARSGYASMHWENIAEPGSELSLSSAGDFDNDGYDDLLLGRPSQNTSLLIYGDSRMGQNVGVPLVTTQFLGSNLGDRFGQSVHSAGDINGDGYDDVIIGAPTAARSGAVGGGEANVFFGRLDRPETILAATVNESIRYMGIGDTNPASKDPTSAGREVSGNFDFDGDGFDEILIAAPGLDREGRSGADRGGYAIIWGGDCIGESPCVETVILGSENNDNLNGTSAGDSILGSQGDDQIDGREGRDVLRGAHGDDRILITSFSHDQHDGGRGQDALVLTAQVPAITSSELINPRFREIEELDLSNHLSKANQFLINPENASDRLGLYNLSDTSNQLKVRFDPLSDLVPIRRSWDALVHDHGDVTLTYENATLQLVPSEEPFFTVSRDGRTELFVTEGDDGINKVLVDVELHNPTLNGASVLVSTGDLKATVANGDYVPISDWQLTFAPGETLKTIEIDVIGDPHIENLHEDFWVQLHDATDAGIVVDKAYVNVTDNESRTVGESSVDRFIRFDVTEAPVDVVGRVAISEQGHLRIGENVRVNLAANIVSNGTLSVFNSTISGASQFIVATPQSAGEISNSVMELVTLATSSQDLLVHDNLFTSSFPIVAPANIASTIGRSNQFDSGVLAGTFLINGDAPDNDVEFNRFGTVDQYHLIRQDLTDNFYEVYEFKNLTVGPEVEVRAVGYTQLILDVKEQLKIESGGSVRVRNAYYLENGPKLDLNATSEASVLEAGNVNGKWELFPDVFGRGGRGGAGGSGAAGSIEARPGFRFSGRGGNGGKGGNGGVGGGVAGSGGLGGWGGPDGDGAPSIDGIPGMDGLDSAGEGESGVDSVIGEFCNNGCRGGDGAEGGNGGYGGGVLSIYADNIRIESETPALIVSGQIGGSGGKGIDDGTNGQAGQNGEGGLLLIRANKYNESPVHWSLGEQSFGSTTLRGGHGVVTGDPSRVVIRPLQISCEQIPGDSNCDGVFNSGDLIWVFSVGEFEDDIPGNSTFADGDWNRDGDFDSGDFVFVFQARTYVATAKRFDFAAATDMLFDDKSEDTWGVSRELRRRDHHSPSIRNWHWLP